MRLEGLRSQTGYRRRPGKYGGKPAVASPNLLKRQFDVREPNKVWVTDITYIRTYEGWLYLGVVLDLFSRQIIGWSMKSQMTSDVAIDALLMAVWRRKPKKEVMIHSDQGSQGGFNRSSQHLDRGVYGTIRRMDAKIDGPGSDAFSRCTLSS